MNSSIDVHTSRATKEFVRDISLIHEIANRELVLWREGPREVVEKININGQRDVVTRVDIAIEALAHSVLGLRMPVYGEETSDFAITDNHGLYAVIDPIDGTKELLNESAEWSISIAIMDAGVPIVASIYMPDRNEHYLAIKGLGLTLNGEQITRKNQGIGRIAVSPRQYLDPMLSQKIVDIGHTAYPTPALTPKICAILRGDVDAAVYLPHNNRSASAAIWDYAAAPLLLSEIGGRISSCDGTDLPLDLQTINHHAGWVASSSNSTHATLLEHFGNITLT
jgi:myo-inositol-1(or 4)-monophosphatase